MDITLTLSCNNNCIFCPREEYLSIISCKSKKNIYSQIKKTRQKSDKITLSGGEVTLMDKIIEMVSFCRQQNFKVIGIITNGRKLKDKKFAEKIIKAGVNDFAVSLYSCKPSIHDKVTRIKGSCLESKKGLKNLISLQEEYAIFLRVNLVFNRENRSDIFFTLERLQEMGVRSFIVAEQIILNKSKNHLNLTDIKKFLSELKKSNLRNSYICLRGFADCLISEPFSKRVLREKNPRIVLEPYCLDTLVEKEVKKREYLSRFSNLFIKTERCLKCASGEGCLGLQKAYW